ncbi:MAG: YdcF family protein [Ruminococcus sp.]|nr:YdcF family protein [Ruminococcus sp.]
MMMRAVPALISFILLMLFILPVIRIGNINIGNIAGGAVSLGLLLIFLFPGSFRRLIHTIKETAGGRALLWAVGIIVVICAAAAIVISCFMVRAVSDPPTGPTTVVILGCQVKNGGPSKMLRRRLEAAYSYLSEHEEVMVVVSGGKGDDEEISEAQCMAEYLTAKGIAPDRIFMEDKSTSTEENLSFSKAVIEENGLCPDITIVTDGYHQLRAEILARRLGYEPWHISAKTAGWLLPTYWVREWFGVAYYVLSGIR